MAYLDCIHELVYITFIVFIRNTRLPGASAYKATVDEERLAGLNIRGFSVIKVFVKYFRVALAISTHCLV